ncbi:RHS domain-containing protein, partial [Pseudomonas sp. HY7a-MNA-CIBAN-0227]|uniref:RHS repeat domain-containing protein n=1 Tax=Pseudomonas sp. HY7a-MNA-CIBAN-0227 TaxID=3140474 RepID=UPI0033258F38
FGPEATKPFHYQLDHLGTPQELTNPNGEIVWSAHYRAYGQIAKLDVNTVTNPLRFQGQYFDQESGLHYNRHRYYN